MMGLYQDLEIRTPYDQRINNQGKAYKTTSDLLFGSTYDANRTAALELSDEIRGAAFVDGSGAYTYVLWAKTQIDRAETATATYTFPASLGLGQLYKKEWNYSETGTNDLISTSNIALTGTPIFLTEAAQPLIPPIAQFRAEIQEGCAGLSVQFQDESLRAENWKWTFEGANIENSTLQNPMVTYPNPGTYQVRLEAFHRMQILIVS